MEIDAYEASMRWTELMLLVNAGKQITITQHGKAIADLVPRRARALRHKRAAVDKFHSS